MSEIIDAELVPMDEVDTFETEPEKSTLREVVEDTALNILAGAAITAGVIGTQLTFNVLYSKYEAWKLRRAQKIVDLANEAKLDAETEDVTETTDSE